MFGYARPGDALTRPRRWRNCGACPMHVFAGGILRCLFRCSDGHELQCWKFLQRGRGRRDSVHVQRGVLLPRCLRVIRGRLVHRRRVLPRRELRARRVQRRGHVLPRAHDVVRGSALRRGLLRHERRRGGVYERVVRGAVHVGRGLRMCSGVHNRCWCALPAR